MELNQPTNLPATRPGSLPPDDVPKPGRVERIAQIEERRRRIRYIIILLAEGRSRSYVKTFFRKTYNVSARSTERYMAEALTIMAEEAGQLAGGATPEELIAKSYAFYMGVISDDKSPMKEKLRARELADKLLALPDISAARVGADPSKDADKKKARKVVGELSEQQLRILAEAKEIADAGGD